MKCYLSKLSRLTVLLAMFLIENIRGPPLADTAKPIYNDGVECFASVELLPGPFASAEKAGEGTVLHPDRGKCHYALEPASTPFFSSSNPVALDPNLLAYAGGWMPDPEYLRAPVDHTSRADVPARVIGSASESGMAHLDAPPSKDAKAIGSRSVNRIPYPKRIDLGHVERQGIGSSVGYSKLAAVFGPEYEMGKFLPLGELRGVVYNDGTLAANVGFIGRFLPKSLCQVYGFNLFYDFRQGEHRNHNQLSGGFEVLSKRWEVHTDALIAIGGRGHYKTFVFDYPGGFHAVCRCYEFANSFVDARVGYYPVVSKNFQLYMEAGPYYLSGKFNTASFGGRALIRPQFSDWCSVACSVSHDAIFKTIWQVNVVFSLPLYNFSSLKNKTGPCGVSNRQIYQPIDRDIILGQKCCWGFSW